VFVFLYYCGVLLLVCSIQCGCTFVASEFWINQSVSQIALAMAAPGCGGLQPDQIQTDDPLATFQLWLKFWLNRVCNLSKKVKSLNELDLVFVVVVLKSDNANGLFGFAGRACQPAVVPMTVSELNCTVRRQRGAFDSATAVWQIEAIEPTVSVLHYFINSTGIVRFSDQQTLAVSLFMYSYSPTCCSDPGK